MIAIIPCAGKGTRRRPDTNFTPKILLDYQGKPLIEHIVRPIDASGGFEKIVLVLSPKHGQKVIDYINQNPFETPVCFVPFETPVSFVWQNEPLGFGHAVLQARDEVFSFYKWNPPVLIHTDDAVNTQSVPRIGMNGASDKSGSGKNLIEDITAQSVSQIGVQWRGNVRNYGMVIAGESEEAREQGGEGAGKENSHTRHLAPTHAQRFVERLVEKPYWDEGGLAITGIYYVRESRRLFRCLNKLVKTGRCLGGEFQFTHALQMMIDAGTPFQTYYHDWVDCGKTENEKTRERENEK